MQEINKCNWVAQTWPILQVMDFGFLQQAWMEMVKIENPDFFLLGLKYTLRTCFEPKKFLLKSCPELSNQVSVFQLVKFTSSFKFVCRTIFTTFWHLALKFGYDDWFLINKISSIFTFRWIIGEIRKSLFQFFQKKTFDYFFALET